MDRMNRDIIVATGAFVLALLVAALLNVGCHNKPPAPPEIDTLPPVTNTAPEIIVKEVPGPERIVERVKLVTKTVTVTEEGKTVVKTAETPNLRVRFDATKTFARNGNAVTFGWEGMGFCEVNDPADKNTWIVLGSAPLNLKDSEIIGEPIVAKVPEKPKLHLLSFGVGYGTEGLVTKLEYRRALTWKSKAGRVLMPADIGVEAVVAQGRADLLGTFSYRF